MARLSFDARGHPRDHTNYVSQRSLCELKQRLSITIIHPIISTDRDQQEQLQYSTSKQVKPFQNGTVWLATQPGQNGRPQTFSLTQGLRMIGVYVTAN